ncbi:MAG: S8 family peptidase [Ignavibacteria bacterium]|jgi:subtilisin family serine protease|nr:S8 family peptidase [Ignavibacteria bacterium]
MKYFSIFTLFLLSILPAYSQNNLSVEAYQLLRAYNKANDLPAKEKLKEANSLLGNADSLQAEVLVLYDNKIFSLQAFEALGGEVEVLLTKTFTAVVPLANLLQISELTGVLDVTVGEKDVPDMDKALVATNVIQIQNAFINDTEYTGKGVILGVIDNGFDFTHPMFSDKNGKCRVIRAWIPDNGTPPSESKTGNLYTDPDIIKNSLKKTSTTANHASHVLGIAAGTNESGMGELIGFGGVAPEADIAVIEKSSSISLVNAIEYLFHLADTLNKPIVINYSMSYGSHMHAHDGTYTTDVAVNELLSKNNKGKIFVTSGGNEGNDYLHSQYTFNNDTLWSAISTGTNRAYIVGDPGDEFSICVQIVDKYGDYIGTYFYSTATSKTFDTTLTDEYNSCTVTFRTSPKYSINERPYCHISLDNEEFGSFGMMRFGIVSKGANIHIWGGGKITQVNGSPNVTNSNYSVGAPADLETVIAVGAYITRNTWNDATGKSQSTSSGKLNDLANFSSKGPTLDGIVKPDITAPGCYTVSASNHFYQYPTADKYTYSNYPDGTPNYRLMQGTSMSSPIVAGVIALMLQAKPDLTLMQIKNAIKETAINDTWTGNAKVEKSNNWGWGKINAGALLAKLTDTIIKQPAKPILTSPADDANVVDFALITFKWESSQDAALYSFQISSDGTSYQNLLSNTTSIILQGATNNKTYYWRVRAINAVGDSSDLSDVWTFKTGPTSIADTPSPEISLLLFPNAVTNNVSILVNGVSGVSTIQVFDISGNMIYTNTIESENGFTDNVDMSNYATGSYLVRVSNGKDVVTEKLIKK